MKEDEVYDLMSKDTLTGKDKMLFDIFTGYLPSKFNYDDFVADIEKVGYKKKVLTEKKCIKIDSIFCTRYPSELVAYSCIAEYRDILVFTKDDKISGIAKICFQCNKWDMAGTVASPDNFGQSGEFDALYQLLNTIDKQVPLPD